mgnify:CR=1 FL=1
MERIKVSASREYDVIIDGGILRDAGKYIESALGGHPKLAIITDDRVDSLHGEALEAALSDFEYVKFVFKNGEASKNIKIYGEILEFLAENDITRTDAIVAFGGGVVGDMAGFAASTFLRGIRFVQIPTTLLAMVDSSVGGKTAIDLGAGKNLCGTFWQPSLVLCDPYLLRTLEDETFSDGMAEVIKYGVIFDKKYGIQFTPVATGSIYNSANAECVRAAKMVLEGTSVNDGVLYFVNPSIASNSWVQKNRRFAFVIGNHYFYY